MESTIPNLKAPIEHCPVCGGEIENFFLTDEDEPVYVDTENECIKNAFFTNVACFVMTPSEDTPLCDIVEIHHEH